MIQHFVNPVENTLTIRTAEQKDQHKWDEYVSPVLMVCNMKK